MYKEGDTVTLSATTTISIGNYSSIKPSVSITRVMGANPTQDLEEMENTLKDGLKRVTIIEAGFTNDLLECLKIGGLDTIKQYCENTNGTTGKSKKARRVIRKKKVCAKKVCAKKDR